MIGNEVEEMKITWSISMITIKLEINKKMMNRKYQYALKYHYVNFKNNFKWMLIKIVQLELVGYNLI